MKSPTIARHWTIKDIINSKKTDGGWFVFRSAKLTFKKMGLQIEEEKACANKICQLYIKFAPTIVGVVEKL